MVRRAFLAGVAAVGAAKQAWSQKTSQASSVAAAIDKPAILGGTPVHSGAWPKWPIFGEPEEKAIAGVLQSGKWYRGSGTENSSFEKEFAQLLGANHVLATANGTSALIASLAAVGIQAGDEVVLPPYTFSATVNAVLLHHAVPVFADVDRASFQINPSRMGEVLSSRTRLLLPVHLGGAVADMDAIGALGKAKNIPVIEDACQSHLAEWKGRRVGTMGLAGTYSFQASKNLNSGEGGAIVTNDEKFVEACYIYSNNGRGHGQVGADFSYHSSGANLRLSEFQAALLRTQMTRLEAQSKLRETNAEYLSSLLRQIPGLTPSKPLPGCTRNAYHLYMFRYDPAHFAGLSRANFLQAIKAEGIGASRGYTPLQLEPWILAKLQSRGFQRFFTPADVKSWQERSQCPENDKLCAEAVWLTQTMLLGSRQDMDHIAEAAKRIQRRASEIAKL